jgi:hypothetical protein
MKRAVIAAVAGLGVAAGIGLAAPAQAAPCSYFGDKPSSGICGVPGVSGTIANAQKNLQNNFSVSNALKNLGFALTHGVGSDAAG